MIIGIAPNCRLDSVRAAKQKRAARRASLAASSWHRRPLSLSGCLRHAAERSAGQTPEAELERGNSIPELDLPHPFSHALKFLRSCLFVVAVLAWSPSLAGILPRIRFRAALQSGMFVAGADMFPQRTSRHPDFGT